MNYVDSICQLADKYEQLTCKAGAGETAVDVPSPFGKPFDDTAPIVSPMSDKTMQSAQPSSNLKMANIPGFEDFVQAIDFLREAYGYLGRGNIEMARPIILRASQQVRLGMKEVFNATPEKDLASDIGYSTR